jgi:class 3 adenylate cyclase/tetratricopeptide (TPR) repeat protein
LATLVFCDLVGSTALGERVDPEALQELLALYFGEMQAGLKRHGGSVEKFIGDAVVGVFGVPVAQEDDALRACRAALEMQERVGALNPELEERFGTRVEVRVGVNSGEVVGSRETFVTGDAANVAARLEQGAGPGEVLLGKTTYRLVRGAVRVEPREPLHAKGKSEPVTAYRLLGVASPGAVRQGGGTPFVGREVELMLLEAQFEAAVEERRCRLVTVVGEPGVGKSRLAAELIDGLGPRARAVRGACLSYGEGITYWALAQVVRELAGIGGELSREAVRGLLGSFLAQAPEGGAVLEQILLLLGIGEGSTTPEELAWATRRFLAAAAAERPLVLVVDDVQWAEPALLELLESLPESLAALTGDAPTLVVCLARPEVSESRPGWPVTLRLEPLAAAAVDALLEDLGAPAAMRVQIAQTAAGNPLFAEELVAWVGEGGDLAEMPTSLNALLAARLDRLDPHARAALERGAVEGELFHQAAIVELTEEASRPSVPAELGTLARKDLIRLAAASLVAGGVAYRFKHILVREAAYLAMTKKMRASLHEAFADWLERFAGDRAGEYAEIVGYHLEQAHRYRSELGPTDAATRALGERAARHLGAAGRRATVRGDYHAAANLLERAMALGVPDPHERLALQVELGLALLQTRRIAEGEALLDSTVEAATALGERGLAARALVHASYQRLNSDPTVGGQEMISVAEEAISTFESLDDRLGLAEAEEVLGGALVRAGRFEESMAANERALAHAQASGATGRRRSIISGLGNRISGGPMPVEEGIGRLEQLLGANRDDRVVEAVIRRQLAYVLAMAGRFDEARAQLETSTPVLDEVNLTEVSWGGSRWRVWETLELLGDTAAAEQDLIAVWLHFRDTRGERSSSRALLAAALLALLCCDQGRWDEAANHLTYGKTVDCSPPPSGKLYVPLRFAARARIAARVGQHAEADEFARTAVEFAPTVGWDEQVKARAWLALAEIRRATGNDVGADEAIERALGVYDRKGNITAAARVRASAP